MDESQTHCFVYPCLDYTLGNLLSMAWSAIAQTVFTQDDFLATVPSAQHLAHSLEGHAFPSFSV